MNIVKQSLLIGSGFAGGFAAGLFLSSYKKSEAFREQCRRVETALTKVNHSLKVGTAKIREINQTLKKEFTHPIPDLYRATESLRLSEDEIIYD